MADSPTARLQPGGGVFAGRVALTAEQAAALRAWLQALVNPTGPVPWGAIY
jgi:hypothetical protein